MKKLTLIFLGLVFLGGCVSNRLSNPLRMSVEECLILTPQRGVLVTVGNCDVKKTYTQ